MVIGQKLITFEEFEAFTALQEHRDRNFELIDGEIIEKAMPTKEHGFIAGYLIIEIGILLKLNPIGRIGPEIRHRVDNYNARQPDVSFYLYIAEIEGTKGTTSPIPDLAIEVKSPTDTYKAMRERAQYYVKNDVKLVWLIFPEKRIVEVYTADKHDILTENDTLDGGDLLRGFSLAVTSIFDL